MQKIDKTNFDPETRKWFEAQPIGAQTTVCRCQCCNLLYKHELGHKCAGGVTDGKVH